MAEAIAIITGAGRGIGRATAVELCQRGYRCILVARSESELKETASLCGDRCGLILKADIASLDEITHIVDTSIERFERVDALVHCAGAAPCGSIESVGPVDWQKILDVNLSPVVHFARLLWPHWRKQGGGVMVNVSSYAARDPFPGLGLYGAAKAGVNLLGLALSREGAPLNIRIHTVAPAATETAMFRSLFSPDQVSAEQTLEPAQVARVIAQCVNGDLAVTSGEVIYVHQNA